METVSRLTENYFYLVAIILFVIGTHTMLTHSNMIKKVIAMNIMDSSVFLLFVAIGYTHGAQAPIIRDGADIVYANPLPGALIVTGIVVAVSVTAYALSIIVKIQRSYGTIDCDEICELRSDD
ncbi:MAG: sodium:proton antiporter [Dethiobacteria bacterium]|nr:cation:proton antiporter subunit C [Bacillota bacterium]MDW7728449.1 cation:proton antiporter subunit C [Bacillota bacterium]